MRFWTILLPALALSAGGQALAQSPSGLAASVLADTTFRWTPRTIPGFRVNFLVDSYPAHHQDSLLARLTPAATHARELIGADPLNAPIDLFFVETRAQMAQLIGGRATGFAQPSTRSVILVTNPDWRAFERHEIMHVIAGQAWGTAAPNMDWLVEGLAQAADGNCAGRPNAEVLLALVEQHGWIPLSTVLTAFRRQPDLRAYLQAASFVEYLLQRYGPESLHDMWTRGATEATMVGGESLATVEERWRNELRTSLRPATAELARVEAAGCG